VEKMVKMLDGTWREDLGDLPIIIHSLKMSPLNSFSRFKFSRKECSDCLN